MFCEELRRDFGTWNVGVEKPLSVHSLLKYHEDLDPLLRAVQRKEALLVKFQSSLKPVQFDILN